MSFEKIRDTVMSVVRENIAFAEPAVFVMGFAEGVPGLSLLIPSSALFLGVGAIHAAAGGQFWHLWLAASLGAMLGDVAVYMLGRQYKNEVAHTWPLSRHPEWWSRGHTVFERWGILAVVGGKFTGFMRPVVPAIAGVLEMPLWQFLPASIVASLLWAGAFLAPGYGLKWFID